MRQRALRRAVGASIGLCIVALLLSQGVVGMTFALFSAETTNANSTFAGGWVDAATAGTVTPSGYDVKLAWTPGTAGPVTGQQLNGVTNSSNPSCTGAAYALLTTLAGASTAAYTDASRGTVTNNGDYYCYELVSTSATSWTGLLDLPAVQVGLAASNVALADHAGGTANTIETNDTATITFNQKTNLPATSVKVCVFGAPVNTILLGDAKSGNNCGSATADGYTIAKLTTTSAIAADTKFSSSGVVVSSSAPWTVKVTLGSGTSTTVPSGASWTLVPAAAILSSITVHQAAMCTRSTSTCQPTTSTNF